MSSPETPPEPQLSAPCNITAQLTGTALGCDLVFIPRVARAYKRFGAPWLARLFTTAEREYCLSPLLPESRQIERMASRIAVKEAVAKALGLGVCGLGYTQGLRWQEVSYDANRALQFSHRLQQLAQAQGVLHWQVSVAHDGDYAMATVLAVPVGYGANHK